jgi:hypothetical protein
MSSMWASSMFAAHFEESKQSEKYDICESDRSWEKNNWQILKKAGEQKSWDSTDEEKFVVHKIKGIPEEIRIEFVWRLKWDFLSDNDKLFKTGTVTVDYKDGTEKWILSDSMYLHLLKRCRR